MEATGPLPSSTVCLRLVPPLGLGPPIWASAEAGPRTRVAKTRATATENFLAPDISKASVGIGFFAGADAHPPTRGPCHPTPAPFLARNSIYLIVLARCSPPR